ncbi:MAG: hypothetical protein ACTSO9_01855, partial [Candidatus Helarchaeota archaeon]
MKKTVVLDINPEYIKAGFSGEERPRITIPNIIGLRSKSRLDEVMKQHLLKDTKLDKDVYFGKEAINNRFNLKLKRPIAYNFNIDRELLVQILEYIIFNLLNVKGRQNYVICHPLLVPNHFVEKLVKIFFEKFNPLGLSMISEPYATLLETNRPTGLVLYMDSSTQILPVWEGTCFEQHANIYEISIIDIKEQLENLISSRSGLVLSEFDIEEILKYCIVAKSREHYRNLMHENVESISSLTKEFDFNDKHIVIDLERFTAPEIFFDPVSVGMDLPTFPEFIDSVVDNFERNIRKDFYQSIIIGGRGCFKGFPERVERDLEEIINFDIIIKSFHPSFSEYIAWIGTSKLSAHPDFPNFMISSSEYFEEGFDVIDKVRFEKYNIYLNLKDIKLLPIFQKKELKESTELIDRLRNFLKQYVTIDLGLLAESFGVFQDEMVRFLKMLLKKGKIQGQFLENNEFKIWTTTEPEEVERIKQNLIITIRQSSEILHKHYAQRLKNLEEIHSLKTFRARADEFYKKIISSDEKMKLLLKKSPIPISKEDEDRILKSWNLVFSDVKARLKSKFSF